LILASAVVAVFVGLNLYTYMSQHRSSSAPSTTTPSRSLASVTIPVEGMTCFTCELTVESSLKKLPGVQSADAKVNEAAAYVSYDPAKVSLVELIAAINKTGYRATQPQEDGGQPWQRP
jgi:copper chaperone CopZ